MKPIDVITNHFAAQETKRIEVPEWADTEGKPLVILADPLTVAEKGKFFKMAKDDDLSLLVYALIFKAKDVEGNKMFTLADKKALMEKSDPDVVARVANEIMKSKTTEEQLGN